MSHPPETIAAFTILIGSCSCGKEVAQRVRDDLIAEGFPTETLECPDCGNVIASLRVADVEIISNS